MAAGRIPVLPTNKVVDLLFRSMQHVHSSDLHNTAECHICNEPFLTGQHPERPVILRCGHILGEGCILKWMSPLSRNGQNTCPLCRRTLLDVGAVGVPTTYETQSGNYEQRDLWHQIEDIAEKLDGTTQPRNPSRSPLEERKRTHHGSEKAEEVASAAVNGRPRSGAFPAPGQQDQRSSSQTQEERPIEVGKPLQSEFEPGLYPGEQQGCARWE
ncbi:hypothetical protein BDR22DRAFT_888481 [Usnea florida]